MAGKGGQEQDAISAAIHEAMVPIGPLEKDWNIWKLEGRMTGYFRNGAKNMDFEKGSWDELVYEYADHVFNSIFSALPDRTWHNKANLLKVMQVSIQQLFPANLLAEVSPEDFEQIVICAHDQAYEEQRFAVILDEALKGQVKDKKLRSKLYSAFEVGRRDAALVSLAESLKPAEDFMTRWVLCSVERLRVECNGWPESLLQPSAALWLFNHLVDAGAFPVSLVVEHGQPLLPGWPVITHAVKTAYESKGRAKVSKAALANSLENASRILPIYSVAGNGAYWRKFNGEALAHTNGDKSGGHPECTQAEDCRGNLVDNLCRHIPAAFEAGDLYCATCWALLSAGNPTLKALPFATGMGN